MVSGKTAGSGNAGKIASGGHRNPTNDRKAGRRRQITAARYDPIRLVNATVSPRWSGTPVACRSVTLRNQDLSNVSAMGVVVHFDWGNDIEIVACGQKGKVGVSRNPMDVTCERCLITDSYDYAYETLSGDQRTSGWLGD